MLPEEKESGARKDDVAQHVKDKPESFAARIAASASGLAKEVVKSSTPFDAAKTLSHGASASNKIPQGSSSGESARWAESLPTRSKSSTGSSSDAGDSLVGESFRTSPQSDATSLEFDGFIQDYGMSSAANTQKPSGHSSWTVEFSDPTNAHPNKSNLPYVLTNHHDMSIEYDDGAAVRELLSGPGDLDETYNSTFSFDEPSAETVSDLFRESNFDIEKQIAGRLRAALPAAPSHSSMPSDHPLNLRPEFLSQSIERPELLEEIQDLASNLELITGACHLDNEQRDHFLSEWNDVLSNYTDEVWGSMLPAVKEAKSQLEDLRTGKQSLDSKTVARLKMILGHVVQSSVPQRNGLDGSSSAAKNFYGAKETENRLQSKRAALSGENNSFHTGQAVNMIPTQILETSFVSEFTQRAVRRGLVRTEEAREATLSQDAERESPRSTTRSKPGTIGNHTQPNNISNTSHLSKEESSALSTFHCPWIRCHEVCSQTTMSLVNGH
jgi:hypothetical protein